ncbi:cytidylyltransferase domain-containing protein [Paenibacillus sp. GXUN7292]|uniref:cytidylyltransferase domain-containing protein n=1 Tax=Paenibacillus sp. GXUN7292 TaxID=3422499 RepID=UPI003D7D3880
MNTVAIVQARMTSSRLPGKVLKEVMGKPLIEYLIERLRRVKHLSNIVIATTVNDSDQSIVELCDKLGVDCFRGSEEDVLSRYYKAALHYRAEHIVRITSDCPVIDPEVVDQVISYYFGQKSDYTSNGLVRSFPRGLDTEVFSFKVLEEAHQEAKESFEREHVTPFLYNNRDRFSTHNYSYKYDCSYHRWTVDTQEDFILIQKIIEALYNKKSNFTLEDCLELLEQNPEWINLNAHVEQKRY